MLLFFFSIALRFNSFMQDLRSSRARKPWYQRAMGISTLRKTIPMPEEIPITDGKLWDTVSMSTKIRTINSKLWKSISRTRDTRTARSSDKQKLMKCTSLRVFLCVPMSSYNKVFRADLPPRRSNSYPRSKNLSAQQEIIPSGRFSIERRRIFRGKSLTDDILMRRFVIQEEAMMQVRRKNQMEIVRQRSMMRRKRLGPSPLSRMVMAGEEHN